MTALLLIARLAALKTDADLDGDMSGDEAASILSGFIDEARTIAASTGDPVLDGDGLQLVATMKALIDEALTTHIYEPDEVPADCHYLAASNAAEIYLRNRGADRP